MELFSSIYPSLTLFSPVFREPPTPAIATELHGIILQHKWNDNVSHIVSGYWYNSASHGQVRIDETYEGAFGSSLFDYTDINAEGAVKNRQIIVAPSVGSTPSCFDEYVEQPGFPLITKDFLQAASATFGGIVTDPLIGESQTWNLLYGSATPVTVYLDAQDPPVVMGYDFSGADQRTKVVTRFLAHQSGGIGAEVFEDFPCPASGKHMMRSKEWKGM